MGGNPEGDFIEHWGWFVTIDEITGGDPFKEEELFSWPVRKFYNRLAFLKEKAFVMEQKAQKMRIK